MRMCSSGSLSVLSAQTRRHAAFGKIDPPNPECAARDASFVHAAELPDTRIGRELLAVRLDERRQRDTADLLFALDEELDVARQLPRHSLDRVDRGQAAHDVTGDRKST